MKIVIASEGKSDDSEISQRGARAPFYLVFEDGKLVETIKNSFAVGGGGAGFSVAYLLAKKDVGKLICGRVGPNMEFALKEKGIKFETAFGKVNEFVQSFR